MTDKESSKEPKKSKEPHKVRMPSLFDTLEEVDLSDPITSENNWDLIRCVAILVMFCVGLLNFFSFLFISPWVLLVVLVGLFVYLVLSD